MQKRSIALAIAGLALAAASFAASAADHVFSNTNAIAIPDSPSGQPTGHPASLYPSSINVSGVSGPIENVRVTLNGFSHTFPGDLGIMLVGPGGQQVMLMGQVGSGADAVNTTLTFDAAATSAVTPSITGTYLPAYNFSEPFPAPAPAVNGNTNLAVFDNTSGNGTWSLFVTDQVAADSGNISGGWTLTFADTISCASEGYTYTKLEWCKNICERGYTGATLNMWIRRWVDRYRQLPYCAVAPPPAT